MEMNLGIENAPTGNFCKFFVFSWTHIRPNTNTKKFIAPDSETLPQTASVSLRHAAAPGLLSLLVRPPGTVFRTLSAIRTPTTLLSDAC